ALLFLAAPAQGGGRGPAGAGTAVKRAAVLVALLALLAPAAARANGDPASDVLLTNQVFVPFEAPISKQAAQELRATVAEANKKGFKIRVAVIAFTGDLGTAVSLWASTSRTRSSSGARSPSSTPTG